MRSVHCTTSANDDGEFGSVRAPRVALPTPSPAAAPPLAVAPTPRADALEVAAAMANFEPGSVRSVHCVDRTDEGEFGSVRAARHELGALPTEQPCEEERGAEEAAAHDAAADDAAADEVMATLALSADDVALMKVSELRAALEIVGLDTAGKKAVLAERLIDAIAMARESAAPAVQVAEAATTAEEVAEATTAEEVAESVGSMKVAELRAALDELGLDSTGKKAALVERLLAAMISPAEVSPPAEATSVSQPEPSQPEPSQPEPKPKRRARASIESAPAAIEVDASPAKKPKRAKAAEPEPELEPAEALERPGRGKRAAAELAADVKPSRPTRARR